MCLAIPMRVMKLVSGEDDPEYFPVALVEADGLSREIRLDLVSQEVKVGDYLIIHAGFAINVLDEKEAHISLELLREMGEKADS